MVRASTLIPCGQDHRGTKVAKHGLGRASAGTDEKKTTEFTLYRVQSVGFFGGIRGNRYPHGDRSKEKHHANIEQLRAVPGHSALRAASPYTQSRIGVYDQNCPTEPTTDVPIVSGETYWGSNCVLRTTGDVDSFQFTASAGDTWSMVLGLGASPPTDICLTLYAPGSTTPLFSGCTHVYSYPYGEHSVATSEKLKVAGLYTAVVTETSDAVVTYGRSGGRNPRHRTASPGPSRKA